MKIASLFQTVANEDYAFSQCSDEDLELTRFRTLVAALAALRLRDFDAFVLEDHGTEAPHWLAALRQRLGPDVPIAVFGTGGTDLIARALQRGATEYATHAEGPKSLMQRIEARLHVGRQHRPARWLQAGDCRLDSTSHCVSVDHQELALTACEFGLAWALFRNVGQVVTCRALSEEVWGRSTEVGKRSLEQHVYRLRRKLDRLTPVVQGAPRIHTVYGVGYRLQVCAPGREQTLPDGPATAMGERRH